MVKFKVNLKDILGSAYYRYELSSSNYNPNIDNNITITCTCKNVLGNPIANKTLELFQNGTSKGTATTNSNGVANWTVTCNEWGLQNFIIENQTINVEVTGFKKIIENTTYTLRVDESQRLCQIEAHRTNVTISNGHSFNGYSDFVIPSKYYPKSNTYCLIMRNTTFLHYIFNNGAYGITNLGNTVTGYDLAFIHEYHY